MENLNAHLSNPLRFEVSSYPLEDGTEISAKLLIVPCIVKSVSNTTLAMKNKKKTLFRLATVEALNPTTKKVESKQVQLINNLYEAVPDSFEKGAELEIAMQYDAVSKKTYSKLQLPAAQSFNFDDFAIGIEEPVEETA